MEAQRVWCLETAEDRTVPMGIGNLEGTEDLPESSTLPFLSHEKGAGRAPSAGLSTASAGPHGRALQAQRLPWQETGSSLVTLSWVRP